MGKFATFVNGEKKDPEQLNVPALTQPPPAVFPQRITTGKTECERLGLQLMMFCAENGSWKAVPWRMFRNELCMIGALGRLFSSSRKRVPELQSAYVMGVWHTSVIRVNPDGTTTNLTVPRYSEDSLVYNFKYLLTDNLMTIIKAEDEDYLLPTSKLVACLQTTQPA